MSQRKSLYLKKKKIKKESNNMKGVVRLFLILILFTGTVCAENYYLTAVNQAQIDDEVLKASEKKVKAHKDISIRDKLEVPPFHKRKQWDTVSLSLSFCTSCHLQPPHTKNVRSRAFLNMHTQFIACESCHFRPENIKFKYQWYNYAEKTVVTPKPDLFRQVHSNEKKDSLPDEQYADNTQIKIGPFWKDAPAFILRDDDFANETLTIWKKGTLDERVRYRAKIHAPLQEKGPECVACHQQEKPLLNLVALGANKRQAKKIQQHIVPQFFKRYKEDEQRIRINSLLR
jgi:DNA-directed RNA polymerase subunit M/transcription elongation factor TFIIS